MELKIFTAVLIYVTNNAALAINGKDSLVQYNDDLDVKNNIQFILFTRKTKNKPDKLIINDIDTLKKTAYDVSLPTKFVTHGWNSSSSSAACATLVQALLIHGDCNIIVVDWATVASQKYLKAASRVRVIGSYVGKMIAFLRDQGGSLKLMTLIGHSMGAHIMGFAGKNLPNRENGLVEHIVGLDPSGGAFDSLSSDERLWYDDARDVQVVHTNMGQHGTLDCLGYSDFYPNGGGPNQPGCPDDDKGYCAHGRSFMYYVEALLKTKSWYGIACHSFDEFNNGKCSTNKITTFPRWSGDLRVKRVKYMLRTNSKSPFGLGRDGTQPVKKS